MSGVIRCVWLFSTVAEVPLAIAIICMLICWKLESRPLLPYFLKNFGFKGRRTSGKDSDISITTPETRGLKATTTN
ncbi:hypothetical protein LY78DRAFT_33710 [Colletotrichum sublineola]|nr:hypothetical protein LY78DRAFT_33710 [Colletotrichum sublineola]